MSIYNSIVVLLIYINIWYIQYIQYLQSILLYHTIRPFTYKNKYIQSLYAHYYKEVHNSCSIVTEY